MVLSANAPRLPAVKSLIKDKIIQAFLAPECSHQQPLTYKSSENPLPSLVISFKEDGLNKVRHTRKKTKYRLGVKRYSDRPFRIRSVDGEKLQLSHPELLIKILPVQPGFLEEPGRGHHLISFLSSDPLKITQHQSLYVIAPRA